MKNDEAVQEWLDALESGDYSQTRNVLQDRRGYCCLGVACDLFAKKFPDKISVVHQSGTVFYGGGNTSLPESVREWLGLKDIAGTYFYEGEEQALATDNDSGLPFKDIAAIIKKQPSHLFTD